MKILFDESNVCHFPSTADASSDHQCDLKGKVFESFFPVNDTPAGKAKSGQTQEKELQN